jgi:DNA-binding CsgD family transcriptional regulator
MVGFDAPETDRALEEACSAGLVDCGDTVVLFVHPMLQATLYEGLQAPLRKELHESAFRAIKFVGGCPGEAAEHALIAGLTDEVAMSAIRDAGADALRSGAWSTAVKFLGHAVGMAGESASASMIRQFAEALSGAGSSHEAIARLEELLVWSDLKDQDRGRALVVLGEARAKSGNPESILECFEEAARVLGPTDPEGAVHALLTGANVARVLVGPKATMELAERARYISDGLDRAMRLQIDAAWGSAAFMLGDKQGLDLLGDAVDVIHSEPLLMKEFSNSGWYPILWWMTACTFTEQFDEALHAFELGFSSAEDMGWAAAMGAYLLGDIVLKVRVGGLDAAEEDLAKVTGLVSLVPLLDPFTVVAKTGVDLEIGRVTEAEKGCEQLETLLDLYDIPLLALWTFSIRGRLEVHLGRLPEACAAFERCERVSEKLELREPSVSPWWMSAIEGYADAGRLDDLDRVVSMLENNPGVVHCRAPRAAALAGRGFLAEAQGDFTLAAVLFQQAAAILVGAGMPIVRAEVLCWQGGVLRRQGELQAARTVLSEAFQLAAGHRAGLVAFKARSLLRDAGGRVRREPRQPGGLTPRQSQVADLAANGSTNIEIARALGIKARTVEHHLDAVYRSLGVRSRRDLMRRRYSAEPVSLSTGDDLGPAY